MVEHLIIGLGGFGGSAIHCLRQKVVTYQPGKNPSYPKVSYLYVDSTTGLMGQDVLECGTSGEFNVQLSHEEQAYLDPGNLLKILENLEKWPAFKSLVADSENLINGLKTQED